MKRYDVIAVSKLTGRVSRIALLDLRRENAEPAIRIAARPLAHNTLHAVPAGTYSVGDIYEPEQDGEEE